MRPGPEGARPVPVLAAVVPPQAPSAPPVPIPWPPAVARRRRPPLGRFAPSLWGLAGLAAVAALVPLRDAWPARALLLALLLTVPGALLLRALGTPLAAVARTPVYVPVASLVVLLATSLGVNLLGPPLGVEQPLRVVPLLAGLGAAGALLAAAGALWHARRGPAVPWRLPRVRDGWPLLLPLGAAAGAARLNTGHGAVVAAIALAAAVAAVLLAFALAPRLGRGRTAFVLWCAGLAMALSFSLRSGFVYGFDISGEHPIVAGTRAAGVWETLHSGDAYGAMLSLTTLPAMLGELTGLSTLALLKVVYPALLALVPVTVFLLARRHLAPRYAVVAAALLMMQGNFSQQLPAVARQEIGLLLFAVLLCVALDRRMPRTARFGMAALTALALVVSHYSTTYLAIVLLAIAVLVQPLLSLVRPVPRVTGALLVALVALGGGAALWYGPVTESAQNVTRFADDLRADGLRLLPNREAGQGLLQGYLTGNTVSPIDAEGYERAVVEEYARDRPFVRPLPEASEPGYALRDAAVPAPEVRSEAARDGVDRARLVVLQAVNALAVLAAFWLLLARRTRPGLRLVALIGLGALAALGAIRLSGTVATAYNQDRALLQALVPLAVCVAWAAQAAARRARRAAPVVNGAVAVAMTLTLVTGTGLAATALGSPSTNLADSGEDVERFYVTEPELAAAAWAGRAKPERELLYADRYGQLRVIAELGQVPRLMLEPTPRTLDRDAWVYTTHANAVLGRGRGVTGGRSAVYAFPSGFLADHWDRVYDNGTSEVFTR
ncbi:MAG: hypothetical protein AB7G65_19620 [Thermoleophilia bacterium]